MKDLFSIDFRDAIRKVVQRELKEKFGIKPSKDKNNKTPSSSQDCQSKYFGIPIEDVPSKSVKDDQFYKVPIFLVDALEYLNSHVKVEGLFRKSGSVGRQKVLRELLEKDGTCCSCEFVQPHDIAALVKQFFRKLPDPLLTRRLHSTFLKCAALSNPNDSISATALCCLLLPDEHLRVLKYFVNFIAKMANHSLESKMTLSNLAIIFAPNLTCSASVKEKNGEKTMKECMQIVDLIFKNSHLIGMVPEALYNEALTMNQEGGCYSSSGDELEVGDEHSGGRGRLLQRSEKKRDRSKSITGFLRRNFKTNEKSSGTSNTSKHVRSRTYEKPSTVKEDLLQVPSRGASIKEFGEPVWKYPATDIGKQPIKRRNNSKTNMSPVRKSPRISGRDVHQRYQHNPTPPVISLPKLKSVSNQVASTPRRLLQPIQNQDNFKPAALPSKFEIPSSSSSTSSATRGEATTTSPRKRKVRGKDTAPKPKPRPCLSRSKSSTLHHSGVTTGGRQATPGTGNIHGNKLSRHSTERISSSSTSMTYDNHPQPQQPSQHLPQPKISRATQKPHVRKSRRQSSMERRRARYASASQRLRRELPKISDETTLSAGSNTSLFLSDLSLRVDETRNRAFLASTRTRSAPRASVDTSHDNTTLTVNLSSSSSVGKPKARRRLPKTSRSTNQICIPSLKSPVSGSKDKENEKEKSPVTPDMRNIKRSHTSVGTRKPATPYSVTPQIGTRQSAQAVAFVANRAPLVL